MSQISDILRAPGRAGTVWGFAVMLLGVLAVSMPFVSGVATTSLVSVLITAAGIAMTIFAFKAGSFGKGFLQFLFGGITIVAGVAMFSMPMMTMFTLTGVLMVYFVVDGLFAIYNGVKGRGPPSSMTANPQIVPARPGARRILDLSLILFSPVFFCSTYYCLLLV